MKPDLDNANGGKFSAISREILRVARGRLSFSLSERTDRKGGEMVRINGTSCSAEGMCLSAYLQSEGYVVCRIAVEVNGAIIPQEDYDARILQSGDVVEIVSFVGGG